MNEYIIAGEIVKIHSYLLKAPKLRYLVGGSLLIETFSTCLVPEVAVKMGGKIYTAAAGRFLVGFTDRGKAEAFREIVRYVGINLFGEDIFLICGPFENKENILGDIGDALEDMKQSSDGKLCSAMPGLQSMTRCEACGSWGTTIIDVGKKSKDDASGKMEICRHCLIKLKARNGDEITVTLPDNSDWGITKIAIGSEIAAGDGQVNVPYTDNPYKMDEGVTSFEKIAEKSTPKYLGLFYADGNSMGEILYQSKNLDEHKIMSDALIESNKNALNEAAKAISGEGSFPGLVLIKGGDDLLVALPADRAVTFSRIFLEKATQTDDTPFIEGICGGLVLSKSHMPFPILYEKAEELLSSAKKQIWRLDQKEKKHPRDKSAIDFMMVTSPMLESLGNMPERQMDEFKGLVKAVKTIMEEASRSIEPLSGTSKYATFTARPYLLDEYSRLIDAIVLFRKLNLPSRVFMDLKDICLPYSENLDSDGTFIGFGSFIDRMQKLYGEQITNFFKSDILKYNTWEIKDRKAVRQWQADIIEITDFLK